MLKKLILAGCSILAITLPYGAFASDNSCELQVAASTPPLIETDHVAFNISNDLGTSKSFILQAGNPPKIISNLPCSTSAYFISATLFSNINGMEAKTLGQCSLKAGYILLKSSNSSVSVVFPNDFSCN